MLWAQYLFLRLTVQWTTMRYLFPVAAPLLLQQEYGLTVFIKIFQTLTAAVRMCVRVNLILLLVSKITAVRTTKILLDYKCRIPQILAGQSDSIIF